MRAWLPIAGLSVALGLAACDMDMAAPGRGWHDVSGRYALDAVEGYALPVRITPPDGARPCYSDERLERHLLRAGRLELDDYGDFELVLVYEARCIGWNGYAQNRSYILRTDDAYATDGDRIRLYSRFSGATHARGTVGWNRVRIWLRRNEYDFRR